MTSVISSRERS